MAKNKLSLYSKTHRQKKKKVRLLRAWKLSQPTDSQDFHGSIDPGEHVQDSGPAENSNQGIQESESVTLTGPAKLMSVGRLVGRAFM